MFVRETLYHTFFFDIVFFYSFSIFLIVVQRIISYFQSFYFIFSIFSLSLSLDTILKRNYIGEADVTNDSRDVIRTENDTLVWFESGLIVIPGTA